MPVANRRIFTAEYKQRVLAEADKAKEESGGIGALLRREGLYSSHLVTWRRERREGMLKGLTPHRRGPKSKRNPQEDEMQKLRRENQRLQQDVSTNQQSLTSLEQGSTIPVTGHRAQFLNHNRYFLNLNAGGAAGEVTVEVEDTGCGIPKEHLRRVLLPFEQVDNSHTRRHPGTGLGLPLVNALVELHEGSLDVASEIGSGTKMSLKFPAARVALDSKIEDPPAEMYA